MIRRKEGFQEHRNGKVPIINNMSKRKVEAAKFPRLIVGQSGDHTHLSKTSSKAEQSTVNLGTSVQVASPETPSIPVISKPTNSSGKQVHIYLKGGHGGHLDTLPAEVAIDKDHVGLLGGPAGYNDATPVGYSRRGDAE